MSEEGKWRTDLVHHESDDRLPVSLRLFGAPPRLLCMQHLQMTALCALQHVLEMLQLVLQLFYSLWTQASLLRLSPDQRILQEASDRVASASQLFDFTREFCDFTAPPQVLPRIRESGWGGGGRGLGRSSPLLLGIFSGPFLPFRIVLSPSRRWHFELWMGKWGKGKEEKKRGIEWERKYRWAECFVHCEERERFQTIAQADEAGHCIPQTIEAKDFLGSRWKLGGDGGRVGGWRPALSSSRIRAHPSIPNNEWTNERMDGSS